MITPPLELGIMTGKVYDSSGHLIFTFDDDVTADEAMYILDTLNNAYSIQSGHPNPGENVVKGQYHQ